MRALKAILEAAGNLKRQLALPEDLLCLKVLFDVNMPKFTLNYIPLFESITSDLFPSVSVPSYPHTLLIDSIGNYCL